MTAPSISAPLGDLELLRVYQEFDGPRLFSCRSRADQLYLALWADQSDDVDTWLYVAISARRLRSVEDGHITLRMAFAEPEDGQVVVIESHLAPGPESGPADRIVQTAGPHEIPDDWLPMAAVRLNGRYVRVAKEEPIPDFIVLASS